MPTIRSPTASKNGATATTTCAPLVPERHQVAGLAEVGSGPATLGLRSRTRERAVRRVPGDVGGITWQETGNSERPVISVRRRARSPRSSAYATARRASASSKGGDAVLSVTLKSARNCDRTSWSEARRWSSSTRSEGTKSPVRSASRPRPSPLARGRDPGGDLDAVGERGRLGLRGPFPELGVALEHGGPVVGDLGDRVRACARGRVPSSSIGVSVSRIVKKPEARIDRKSGARRERWNVTVLAASSATTARERSQDAGSSGEQLDAPTSSGSDPCASSAAVWVSTRSKLATTSAGVTEAPFEKRIPSRSRKVYVRPPSVGVGSATARSGATVSPAGPAVRRA